MANLDLCRKPLKISLHLEKGTPAGVAELADAADSKSVYKSKIPRESKHKS